jgi:hypothetical protein
MVQTDIAVSEGWCWNSDSNVSSRISHMWIRSWNDGLLQEEAPARSNQNSFLNFQIFHKFQIFSANLDRNKNYATQHLRSRILSSTSLFHLVSFFRIRLIPKRKKSFHWTGQWTLKKEALLFFAWFWCVWRTSPLLITGFTQGFMEDMASFGS